MLQDKIIFHFFHVTQKPMTKNAHDALRNRVNRFHPPIIVLHLYNPILCFESFRYKMNHCCINIQLPAQPMLPHEKIYSHRSRSRWASPLDQHPTDAKDKNKYPPSSQTVNVDISGQHTHPLLRHRDMYASHGPSSKLSNSPWSREEFHSIIC